MLHEGGVRMSEQSFEPDPLDELREIVAAAEKLAADEEASSRRSTPSPSATPPASRPPSSAPGSATVRAPLRLLLREALRRHVRPPLPGAADASGRRQGSTRVHARDRPRREGSARLERLLAIAEKEDCKAWQAELKKLELTRFCHQVCRFVCRTRCKRSLPPSLREALITRISSIPTAQFDAQGFGHGAERAPFPGAATEPGSGGR